MIFDFIGAKGYTFIPSILISQPHNHEIDHGGGIIQPRVSMTKEKISPKNFATSKDRLYFIGANLLLH